MQVLSVEPIAAADLLAGLQRVPLRDGVARPYATARLALEVVDTDTLAPAQNYVLASGVERVLRLREALEPFDVDPFALLGGVWLTTSAGRVPLLPPVVEESLEPDGTTALLVADGLHRVSAARSTGLPLTVVLVRGVDAGMPYYAFPLVEGWDGVEVLDALPEGRQKKAYRQPQSYKALFRDFNAVFPGVQEQRAQTNPAHLRA